MKGPHIARQIGLRMSMVLGWDILLQEFSRRARLGHDFSAMDTFHSLRRLTPEAEVSIGPRLFSHGYSRHFSAFTAIEKKLIFTNLLNLHLYLNGVGLVKEAFSICSDVSRTSQGFRHHPGA